MIVEKGITSEHELTCAVYNDGTGVKALPIIEISFGIRHYRNSVFLTPFL